MPSSSNLTIAETSEPNSTPTSADTARKTSSGFLPSATSSATRRSAACSLARSPKASRLSAFEIAVATSSVKSASRDSMSSGRGSLWLVAAIRVPQSRPSTTIGPAAAERTPSTCAIAPTAPVVVDQSSVRAESPVRWTAVTKFSPSSGRAVPSGGGSQGVSDCATRVAVPFDSKRSIPTASVSRTRAASSVTAPKTLAGDDSPTAIVATRRSAD